MTDTKHITGNRDSFRSTMGNLRSLQEELVIIAQSYQRVGQTDSASKFFKMADFMHDSLEMADELFDTAHDIILGEIQQGARTSQALVLQLIEERGAMAVEETTNGKD